ncbi:hypothetical protein B0T25DRAFT_574656 [Lasiosphaeria hispida]|uniref:Uncharacterized protein n=1 Tax=Lasiosphaeria hispida TaxID=260671 RepID=A0AAJ0M7R1_9PEZI|nr:hypothetical protein B0T25DRAFT_574656 [Lasiosphaeria hispida]
MSLPGSNSPPFDFTSLLNSQWLEPSQQQPLQQLVGKEDSEGSEGSECGEGNEGNEAGSKALSILGQSPVSQAPYRLTIALSAFPQNPGCHENSWICIFQFCFDDLRAILRHGLRWSRKCLTAGSSYVGRALDVDPDEYPIMKATLAREGYRMFDLADLPVRAWMSKSPGPINSGDTSPSWICYTRLYSLSIVHLADFDLSDLTYRNVHFAIVYNPQKFIVYQYVRNKPNINIDCENSNVPNVEGPWWFWPDREEEFQAQVEATIRSGMLEATFEKASFDASGGERPRALARKGKTNLESAVLCD